MDYSLSSVNPILKQAFEPGSPGVARRLKAMETLAQAGIEVGASLMPVLPFLGDRESHLEEAIQAIKEHGGSFVLAGALTMEGVQAERTLAVARSMDHTIEKRWRELYRWEPGGKPSYGPPPAYNSRLGLMVRDLCAKHGLLDRLPRYVAPGPLAVNKRIAERLFLRTYDLKLEQAEQYRIWAYRKAAWAVDEWQENIASIYQAEGEAGLRRLPGVGKSLAAQIAHWLHEGIVDQAAGSSRSS